MLQPEERLAEYIDEAVALAASACHGGSAEPLELSDTFEQLRWFPLPDGS